MPRERKPAERRQNRSTRDLEPVDTTVITGNFAPAPLNSWLKDTADQWSDLWMSDLSSQIRNTDHPALIRLFDWRDEQARCRKRAKAARKVAESEPTVEGSKGQPVANPMWDVAKSQDDLALQIETRIVALEDRLALSPKARLAIGVTQQKGQSLAMANAQIAAAIEKEMRAATDPRSIGGKPSASTA